MKSLHHRLRYNKVLHRMNMIDILKRFPEASSCEAIGAGRSPSVCHGRPNHTLRLWREGWICGFKTGVLFLERWIASGKFMKFVILRVLWVFTPRKAFISPFSSCRRCERFRSGALEASKCLGWKVDASSTSPQQSLSPRILHLLFLSICR